MRVLYVNHTSLVSGAEQSLLVLLRALPDAVSAAVACPEGELAQTVSEHGVQVYPIPGTNLSARLHPLHTTREMGNVVAAGLAIRTLARRLGADLIHANTPRAGLMCSLARGGSGALPLVHVRDSVPPGRLPAAMFGYLAHRASAFVPTSRYLADQLPTTGLARGAQPLTRIVANAIEPDRFDPARIDRDAARARLGLDPREPVIAIVGQISPHKGQSDAIEILQRIRRVHPATRLVVVGSVKFASAATRFDNQGYASGLSALARRLAVEDAVLFLGERSDTAEVLRAVDVLLVPSWYEPFGRVALEGMMMQVPVVATAVGGTKEVLREGRDGLLVAPRRPDLWADSVITLLADADRRAAMGASGRRRALEEFGPASHAGAIVATYEQVLAGKN